MNKSILICFLSLTLIYTAKAQVEFSFGSDSLSASGGTVDVDVLISGFEDIISMQLSFNWDSTVYSFSSIENITDDLDEFDVGSIGTPDNALVVKDGQLTLSWSGPNTAPRSLPDGTRLFTLRLTGIGALCSSTRIEISDTPRVIEVVNNDFEILDASAVGGDLGIFDPSCDTNMTGDELSITIESVTASQGETICIPVTADNFNDILSLQGGFVWDPTVLRFTEIMDGDLLSVNVNDGMSDQGSINVLWVFDQASVSLPNGSTLFELCFEVIGTSGQMSSLEFVDVPGVPLEISDSVGSITDVVINEATFTVGGTGTNGVGLIGAVVNTQGDSVICLPITTQNFDSIGGFQTGITFDPQVLRFREINDVGLSGVDAGEANIDNGELRILWSADFSMPSVTLPDDEVLFEVCFDVIGDEGSSSDIGFASLQDFAIEFSSELGETVEFFVSPGRINVTALDDETGQVTMSMSSSTITTGETTCLDVTVEGFDNIQGMGFAVEWDPAAISFVEARNFNLPSFGTSQLVPVGDNILRVLWNPTSAQSVADGTSIFQLCYAAPDMCTVSSTNVSFISDNVPIEFIGPNNEVLDAVLNDGSITISDCDAVGGVLDISVLETRQPTCFNSTNGSVTVDFPNAVGAVMCVWIRSSDQRQVTTNCNLLSAPGETYELTAMDEDGKVGTLSTTLDNPSAIELNDTDDVRCPTDNNSRDGILGLDISGGTGVYSLTPSLGSQGVDNEIEGLGLEQITVIVQDENGCQVMFENIGFSTNCDAPIDPRLCEGRSIISPDGDRVNDLFVIPCVNDPQNQPNTLAIFDRWGNCVMEYNNYSNDWDGRDMTGNELPEGGYMWVLTTGGAGSRDLFRGTVSILR